MPSLIGDRLKAHWLAQGLAVRAGVSAEQIRSFEFAHGLVLPDDFRDYLAVVNGTGRSTEMDAALFCFWSLEELTSLNTKFPDGPWFEAPIAYFLFADHSLNLPAYAMRLGASPTAIAPIIAVYSDAHEYSWYRVADSFTSFVERYLTDGFVL